MRSGGVVGRLLLSCALLWLTTVPLQTRAIESNTAPTITVVSDETPVTLENEEVELGTSTLILCQCFVDLLSCLNGPTSLLPCSY